MPGEGVLDEDSVDAWGWKFADQADLENILESIGGQGLDIKETLLALKTQEENRGLADLIFQLDQVENPNQNNLVIRGYDSESGSRGGSIADPPAFWINNDTSEDSGVGDRLVNLPVYLNNPGSPEGSDYLDHVNWIDIYAPGVMDWIVDEPPSLSSDYGPDVAQEWQTSSGATPQVQSPPFPLMIAPLEEPSPDYTPTSSQEQSTPVERHLEGCLCNGCIRFSPADNPSAELSFPADMIAVANRLEALKELWILEVDIDRVHREAEIEEREIITEFNLLQGLRSRLGGPDTPELHLDMDLEAHSATSLIDIGEVHIMHLESDLEIIKEYQGPRSLASSMTEHGGSLEDLDIDEIHRAADKDVETAVKAMEARAKSAATHLMAARCIEEKRIDNWEKDTNMLELVTNETGVDLTELENKLYKPP